jgi:hypothetical protein
MRVEAESISSHGAAIVAFEASGLRTLSSRFERNGRYSTVTVFKGATLCHFVPLLCHFVPLCATFVPLCATLCHFCATFRRHGYGPARGRCCGRRVCQWRSGCARDRDTRSRSRSGERKRDAGVLARTRC